LTGLIAAAVLTAVAVMAAQDPKEEILTGNLKGSNFRFEPLCYNIGN
jgi:hypothetical protein